MSLDSFNDVSSFRSFSSSSLVWAGTCNYTVDMVYKLDKQGCRFIGSTHDATLESLAYSQNMDTLEICLPKTGIPLSKTACMNPLQVQPGSGIFSINI